MQMITAYSRVFRNTFHSHTGTPLRDVGPEPVCMPDQAAYSYGNTYNKLSLGGKIIFQRTRWSTK